MNVFTNVTWKSLKKNRTRTLVTIAGIVLSTAMLTSVTALISSLQEYMKESAIEKEGNWYGQLMSLPEEKLSELLEDEEVTAAAPLQELGYARNPYADEEEIWTYHMPYLFVAGMPENFTEMVPVKLKEGRLPENENEIAVPEGAVKKGLMEAEIGAQITLDLGERIWEGETLTFSNPLMYELEDDMERLRLEEEIHKRETRSYTVTGIIGTPAFQNGSEPAYYCLTRSDKEPGQDALWRCFFRIRRPGEIYSFIEEKFEEYGATYQTELLRCLGSSVNRPAMRIVYGMAAILTALIMTGGIALVYNSFAISVSNRTKQFGILASAGATPAQLRGMVFREAVILSAIGIPLGIGAGLLGIGVTLYFTGDYFDYLLYSSEVKMSLHASWEGLLVSALTAFATVLISAWIPAARASGTAPIDAVLQRRDVQKEKKEKKPGRRRRIRTGSLLPAALADRYFRRSRKQYRTTVFSLFISIVLFISASSFSSYVRKSTFDLSDLPEADVEVFLEKRVWDKTEEMLREAEADEILDTFWCYASAYVNPDSLTEEYREALEEAWSMDLDSQVKTEDGRVKISANIVILKDDAYESYLKEEGLYREEYGKAGQLPVTVFQEAGGYSPRTDRYESFGVLKDAKEEIEFLFLDSEAYHTALDEAEGFTVKQEGFERGVPLQADLQVERGPMNLLAGGQGLTYLMPERRFAEMAGEDSETYLNRRTVFFKTKAHRELAEKLQEFAEKEGPAYFFVHDRAESLAMERNMALTVDIFSYGFITLISLIAAANVFNTVSTGFLLRKRDFAVLSSVGMTPKEMGRMLNFECLFYGSRALLYGIPVSVLVTWQIYRVVRSGMDIPFYIPGYSLLIAVFSVFAVVFAAMLYARRKMKHENLIDSIRQESI